MANTGADQVLATLEQRQWLLRHCAFTVYPDRLRIQYRSLWRRDDLFLYHLALPETPPRARLSCVVWIVLACALASVYASIYFGQMQNGYHREPWMLKLGVGFAIPIAAAIGVAIRLARSEPCHILGSAVTPDGETLSYWLHPSQPSVEAVQGFLTVLANARRAEADRAEALVATALGEKPSDAAVLGGFDALHRDGIINEDEYTAIKAYILRGGKGRIGFN
jgi:hypothetical protein